MSLKKTIKGLVERIPYPIGHVMARVPFSWRLGGEYSRMKAECAASEGWDQSQREQYAVEHFRRIFEYARDHFSSYRDLYASAGVHDLKIVSLADIAKVPMIDKIWTRQHFNEFHGTYKLNTGGSSGTPTPFWMDRNCWAREWAHFHCMWGGIGYRYTDLKLAIRGKNLGSRPFLYNPVHNEYVINTYLDVKDYASELNELFAKRVVRWFHGYPSSIYQFIVECESVYGENATKDLFKNVKGLLLSSEYPHPYMVEKFWHYNLNFLSWYGHSEMAILARGDKELVYHPYLTYGLSEVVDGRLVGTSFHNFDMPLIRYDTGDLVESVSCNDYSTVNPEFRIKEGRNGDFIEDAYGKKIPLTALIFGRHHRAFDVADYIQIGQKEPGKAIIYVTMKCGNDVVGTSDIRGLFDLTNINVEFDYVKISKPILTTMGKLRLKVSPVT